MKVAVDEHLSSGSDVQRQEKKEEITQAEVNPIVDEAWLELEKSAKSRFNLPSWERMKSWYSCAVSEEILKQGTLCVFSDWLVFWCDVPMLEVEHCIPIKNIKQVTPEVTAFFFHNAINLRMECGREYMFRSFLSRDEALALIEARRADKRVATSQDYLVVKGGKDQMIETMKQAAKTILDVPIAAPGHVGDVDMTIPNIPENVHFKLLCQDVFPISSKVFVQRFLVDDERAWTDGFEDEGCLDIKCDPWCLADSDNCEHMTIDFYKKLQPGEVPKILGTFERVDIHRDYRRKANASAGVARMHIKGTTTGVPYATSWCAHEIWNFTHHRKGTRVKVEFGIEWLETIRLPGVKGTIKNENTGRTKEGMLKWMEDIKGIIAKDLSNEQTQLLNESISLSETSSVDMAESEKVQCCCSPRRCIIL